MAEHLYRDSYEVQASAYESAGDASASIKRKLKQMGVDSTILRRIAVASYEAELNLIIHSQGGQLPHHQPEGQGKEGPQQTVRADSTGCHRGCCRR